MRETLGRNDCGDGAAVWMRAVSRSGWMDRRREDRGEREREGGREKGGGKEERGGISRRRTGGLRWEAMGGILFYFILF